MGFPMSDLRSTLQSLASQFATNVLAALRGASIEEISEVVRSSSRAAKPERNGRRVARSGRLGRRSADDIAGMVDSIFTLLEKNPDGLRAEQIRDALGVEAKELPRPLAEGLSSGRLTKSGQKRATTYFAGAAGGSASARRRKRAGRAKRG
jgi:hypothetical protein